MTREAILSQLLYEQERLHRLQRSRRHGASFDPRNVTRQMMSRERIAYLESLLESEEKAA